MTETAASPPPLHVVMASPEIIPFAKTGGLADVVGTLARSLQQLQLKISLVLPCYRSVLHGSFQLEDNGVRFTVPVSHRREPASLLKTKIGDGITVYLVRADRYFDREGLYGTSDGDYPDNAERFVFFSRAILELLKLDPPHILHVHDWQAALSVVFLGADPGLYPELSSTKTVLSVHNAAYQGVFWNLDWHLLNLDPKFFTPRHLEFYGKINFLKGGLTFADAITTVSPTYAEEIKTLEQGHGLDGVFRDRAEDLVGILNGIDYDIWNPRTDPFIAERYGPDDLYGKRACRSDLQEAFSLPQNPDVLIVGMVSRLTSQKGFDLLEKARGDWLSKPLQLILLGSGDRRYEEVLATLATLHPDKVGVKIAFDDALAHRIIAGADAVLVPSHYEPCGLVQMYGLRYGTVPIVRATGGLKDTVQQYDAKQGTGNGFVFGPYQSRSLMEAIDQALATFNRKPDWQKLMANGMATDLSWDRSAQAYVKLYRGLAQG